MRLLFRVLAPAAFAAVVCATGEVRAASFDCAKAASRSERLICDDYELSALDSQLEGAFQGALDRSRQPEQVRREQVAWLRRRDAAADGNAMRELYEQRIHALSAVNDPPPGCPGGNTIEMDECGGKYLERADRQLERYVAAVRKQFIEEAEDYSSPAELKIIVDGFVRAEATWSAHRDAECEAVYARYSAGTIRGSMFQSCRQRMAEARVEALFARWLTPLDSSPPPMPPPFVKH